MTMRHFAARAPQGFVTLLRSQVFLITLAVLHAGCVPRSITGAPAPFMPPIGGSVAKGAASLVRPKGRSLPWRAGERRPMGARPRTSRGREYLRRLQGFSINIGRHGAVALALRYR